MTIIPENKPLFAGRVLTGLSCLALVMDGGFKLATPDLMIANSPPLGLPADPVLYRLLGAILLTGVALHLWRRTALLGAILVTAFLGGAIAVNVRAKCRCLATLCSAAMSGYCSGQAIGCATPASAPPRPDIDDAAHGATLGEQAW